MAYQIGGATQRYVDTNGVQLSVYESEPAAGGDPARPAVVFAHGFPELAFSWRHQLPAVAGAGFRAVAADQRGYGWSSRPEPVAAYDIFHLTADLVGLLDALDVERAVFVGHDWGGFVVWQMPLLHPDRVAGVVALNTPYIPRLPVRPTEAFRMLGGENHYIVWFQTPDEPERALAADLVPLFEHLGRKSVPPDALLEHNDPGATFVESVVRAPLLGEPLLEPDEMAVYLEAFRRSGFRGPVNWYRNFDRNWELTPEQDGAHIEGIPCLMITAEWDPVLSPALAQGMPWVVGDLEMHEIPRCGHWTQQEFPGETNRLLVDFLTRRFA